MSKLIPANKELPIREVKPANKWFTDEEFLHLLGTIDVCFIAWTEESLIAFNDKLTEPVNKRAGELLEISTVGQLRQIMISNGKSTDELPADDNAPAYEIYGDAMILDYNDFEGWDDGDDDDPPPDDSDLLQEIQRWLNTQRRSQVLACS